MLGALAHGATRLVAVTIRIARHEGRPHGSKPWLEAVGYAVVVPIRVIAYLACPYRDG